MTPIHKLLFNVNKNELFVKRDDFIPFSFGGNKARKARLFFEDIDNGDYNCIVTYGSSSSNHCRIIANMARARKMPCHIISPQEEFHETYNSLMMGIFGAEITVCPVNEVHDTIENKINVLKKQGYNPYFIQGGGHGNIGTQAYVECYEEIRKYENENNIKFDYIFHASGTGTTQAGLICGQLINRDSRRIVGISIARKNARGRDVILESVKDYLGNKCIDFTNQMIEETTIFIDDYVGDGYGNYSAEINKTIKMALMQYGLPLDATYTGKAFTGMIDYIKKNNIVDANILFIHTGGTPLFFDYLNTVKSHN